VVWPGVTKPNSTCDEIIQSIDWMPTILDMLGLQSQQEEPFDGISIVPALRGDSLSREAIFCFFPHQPAVPEWRPASVYVRKGDWKLIRIFFDGDDQGHRYELYNLKHDISETNNLASRYPKKVRRLDALIEKFLEDSKAVQPKKNPTYRPEALESAGGWKAGGNDHVSLSIENGSLRIHSVGNDPQILTANDLKVPQGPYALEFRMRAKASGDGQVFCPGPDKKIVPGSGVPFQIQHDDAWHEIRVNLPQKDSAGLLRLDPGSGEGVLSIEWIRLLSASGPVILEWTF
jgi:hypothetical protein